MTIHLSERASNIKPSATLSINAKANALRAKGIDIINLSTGEPDATSPEAVCQAAVIAIKQGHTHYTPVDGIIELKQAVADKFKRENSLDYDLSQVIVSTGAKQVLYNACQAILNPGDEAIIPAPYWVSYPAMVTLAGATPVIVETTEEQSFKITPKQLEDAITEKTKLLFLCSPSNPTGMVYSSEELIALADVIKKHPNLIVISDEIYEHVRWDGKDADNIINVCPELYDRTLVVNGVSKVYAMTGWRIGYAGGPKALIAGMKKIQGHSTSGPCANAQYAALKALTMDQTIVDTYRKNYHERYLIAEEKIKTIPLVSALPTFATFYLFINVKALVQAKGLDDDVALCHALLEDAHIAVVPGTAFGAPGYVRMSLALATDNLVEALNRLNNYCSTI